MWQIDCDNFRKVGGIFQLKDVTTEEHQMLCLPLRGAIGFGEYYVEDSPPIFLGKVIARDMTTRLKKWPSMVRMRHLSRSGNPESGGRSTVSTPAYQLPRSFQRQK